MHRDELVNLDGLQHYDGLVQHDGFQRYGALVDCGESMVYDQWLHASQLNDEHHVKDHDELFHGALVRDELGRDAQVNGEVEHDG